MVFERLMLNYWLGELLGWWPAGYGGEMGGAIRLGLMGLALFGGLLWLLFTDLAEVWGEGFWIEPVQSKQTSGGGGVSGVIDER